MIRPAPSWRSPTFGTAFGVEEPGWEASTAAALEAFEAVSRRDLIRSARNGRRQVHSLGAAQVGRGLRSFAIGRSMGGDQTITHIELASAVILASYSGLAERLTDAPEPF